MQLRGHFERIFWGGIAIGIGYSSLLLLESITSASDVGIQFFFAQRGNLS